MPLPNGSPLPAAPAQAEPLTVSVVVPVHFGGEGFRACFRAIREQLGPRDEVVIVADGETDGAWRGLDGPGVRVLLNPTPQGPAHARNRGARAAAGDLLFFVDADCVLQPGAMGRARDAFRSEAGLSAAIGSYDDAPAHPAFLSQYRNLLHHYTHQRSHDEIPTFWGACGAIRRSAFLEVGGFDEGYGRPCIEDVELGYRLARAGHRIRLIKDLQVRHLKAWTPRATLRTDVLDRAAPWTELLLERGAIENNLNVDVRSRWSTAGVGAALALSGLAIAMLGWGLGQGALVAALAAAASGAAVIVVNLPFYRFLRARRGLAFALRAVPWHLLYYACAGAGFALGAARFAWRRLTSPPPEPAPV